jgi:hypothetical protein
VVYNLIYIERTITINKNEAFIEEPIVLYKGDMNIELQFIISNNPFKYKSGTSITYGQLVIKRSEAKPIFSEPAKLSSGKVLFTITGDMIDDLEELGNYDFQIRMINSDQTSRGTLPPVSAGIIIKEPICEEAAANTTYVNKRNAYVMPGNDNIATFSLRDNNTLFDEDGSYIKTEWTGGDIITDTRLNRVEDALYQINDSVPVDYIDTENAVRMINDNNSYIEDYMKDYMDDVYMRQSDMYIYATQDYVSDYINDLEFANQDFVTDMIGSNNEYLEGYISDIYATEDYVDSAISNIELTPGPQGEPGVQGEQGPQGEPGPAGQSITIAVLTQEEYDALETKDDNTFYAIKES